MTGKMALKNKKKNKQKSLRSNRGDSVTFSGRCKSLKMEDDVEFIELNPCITESREAIRQLYQGAVIASPAPSSCTFVSPDSEYGVDLENHPARGQKKKERDEKEKDTRLSPLIELSYASPSPFTTPTPPLSDDRSRPESPYRVACFKPEIKDEPEIVKRTPSPLAIPPDYAFRVSPQRRSPRMFNKRSPSPEWSQSSRKSPRKQLDEPFKVPSAPARPISLDAPGTSGFVASSSAGGGPDPSPSPSSDSGSTATSSFSSGSHLYHTSSSSSGSGSGSGGGSGPGSGASSISGSISIPDPSHGSSDRPSPVEKPEDFDMILDPFKVCTIKNFIQDRDYLEKLRKYLTFKLPYEKRSADMFEYYQGNDDEFSKNRLVQSLEYTFVDKLVPFMSYMFGFPLRKDKLTLSASKYSFTNYLLCHDDVYEDKRIAFVLYLSKKWKKEYGGTLDFFGTNKHNDPTKPITSIIPEYNRLIFFEISPITHHQVSEVIVPEHDRITINGWFHGVFPPAKIIRDPEPQISEIRPANVSDDHIYIDNWMHKMYFSKSRQMRIQALFKENGYVYLPGFMRKEKFKEVVKALREADGWMFIGPPNRRRYEVLPEDLLPNIVKDCLRFFICEAMFLTMFNFTGCKLHALAFAAPEVEIQLKFAKYRMDESPDAETAEDIECDTEILDIATAIERGEPIAANVLYGQFPPSPNSPESPKTTGSRPLYSPEKPSTSKKTATPASPKRTVSSERPPTPPKPEFLKKLASPKKTASSSSPERPSTSKQPPTPERPSTSKQSPTLERPSTSKQSPTLERPSTSKQSPTLERPSTSKQSPTLERPSTSKKPPTPVKPASLRRPTPWRMSPDIDPIPGTSKSQDAPVKVVKKERPTSWLKDKRLDPRATIIIRRWQPGSYSLATDDEDVLAPQGVLDVHFAFDHVAGTCQTHGGYISYVNKETGEEFYRCTPQENVLHLVWLPPSEYRFIKYHNVLAEHVYYDINVIYKE